MNEEQKLKEIKDERLYNVVADEVKHLGCSGAIYDIKEIAEALLKTDRNQIENVNEYIKLRQNFFKDSSAEQNEQIAIKALEDDKERQNKIALVETLHRRVVKTGSNGDKLKEKAREQFKYSKYFAA